VTQTLDHPVTQDRTDLVSVLGESRAEILKQLRRAGDQSVIALAQSLRIKQSTVRCNLEAMLADGLVLRKPDGITGPGRPKYLYRLSPAGMALFPTLYSFLARQLLRMSESGKSHTRAELVESLAEPWRSVTPPRLGDPDLGGRVTEAASRLDEVGVLTDTTAAPGDDFTVSVYHCPMVDVIGESPVACHALLQGVTEAFADVDVRHTEQAGEDGLCAGQCAFFIRPLQAEGTATEAASQVSASLIRTGAVCDPPFGSVP